MVWYLVTLKTTCAKNKPEIKMMIYVSDVVQSVNPLITYMESAKAAREIGSSRALFRPRTWFYGVINRKHVIFRHICITTARPSTYIYEIECAIAFIYVWDTYSFP